MPLSSNVNDAIKAISNLFIFYEKILSKQKTQKRKQATFFPLGAFYAHKNAAFFVFIHLFAFCAFCSLEIFL